MEGIMTMGLHTLLFSHDADATRAFFRDVIELESVDAGGGWLIFALPPAELAVHPTDGETHAELYLMCGQQLLAGLGAYESRQCGRTENPGPDGTCRGSRNVGGTRGRAWYGYGSVIGLVPCDPRACDPDNP
jgi:catechol 2,3-dioxygenase-like lactoylglutathione lyase family enzyme